jgi:hypothetical protein
VLNKNFQPEVTPMTKTFAAIAAAAVIGAAAIAAPSTAEARNGGAVAAGVIGGLAAGAIIGGAVAGPRYAPAYGAYGEPVYVRPRCYMTRERVYTEYGPRIRRVRVCD